ncbi:DUF2750 domain-containing protein [Motiliproteus coralliicola]|uniref:DUF2750 domain-containing protein n=1 Tax=Motiliproteus coralliicola TaxID=2283196 RepID=UPI001402DE87|nr:DUF2750 domain-containing protein [Motiliproteus coralliicola]
MPYKMNEQQFQAVNDLSDDERYRHFISKVADWQQVWGVRNSEGWLTPATPDDLDYFPFWPHPEYAQRIADEHWPGHEAEEFDYEFLITEGLEQLSNDGMKVAVFPNLGWQCLVLDAKQLLNDLLIESERYS